MFQWIKYANKISLIAKHHVVTNFRNVSIQLRHVLKMICFFHSWLILSWYTQQYHSEFNEFLFRMNTFNLPGTLHVNVNTMFILHWTNSIANALFSFEINTIDADIEHFYKNREKTRNIHTFTSCYKTCLKFYFVVPVQGSIRIFSVRSVRCSSYYFQVQRENAWRSEKFEESYATHNEMSS